jgi:tripartite-type tricarboxylate transporter receptor subunit TctC
MIERSMRKASLACACLAAACSAAQHVCAQSYPSRQIRMIVPFTSGGGVDIVARAMAQKLGDNLGQSVIIDNRAGAGSNIGIELAARAAPDGYTLVMVSSAMTINPSIYKTLAYDPVRDFAPISMTSVVPLVLVVHPSVPAASVRELIALGRARKGRLNFASSGIGNSTHLAMELFKTMTKIDMVHVPYKTTAQKNMDVISGQVDLMFSAIPAAMPHVRAGQMRALAVSGLRRSAALADTPTVAEAGVPGFDLTSWNGVLAPAGTPVDIIARLNGEIVKVLELPDIKTRLAAEGAEVAASSPAQLSGYIRSEIAKYAKLVALAAIPKE